ncbi:Phage tape measure protein, partial [Durusdinium trenchii]
MRVNTGGLSKGLGNARGQLQGFSGAVSSVGISISRANDGIITSFAKIGLAIQGVQSLARGIVSAVSGPLSLAASNEQTMVSFEVLTGSAEQATKTLGELRDFASSTPFQLPEISDSAKKLIAFGFSADEVTGELRKLGDISAGLNIPLSDLSDIYGKARVSGRLFMEDINQLAGRGIPIQEELAKQFGVSGERVRDLVSSGKVNFSHLQTAISNLTGEGGKFSGLMAAQSQTLGGVWSTLKDNVGIALGEIGAGIADTFNLTSVTTSITTFVQSMLPRIKGFMEGIKTGFQQVKPILVQGINILIARWNMLSEVGTAVWTSISGALSGFLPSWETIRNALLSGMIAAEFAIQNWKTVTLLTFTQIGASLLGFGGMIQHTFTVAIPGWLSWFGENWREVFSELGRVGQLMFGNFANNVVGIITSIPDLIRGKVSFSDVWTPLTDEATLQFSKLPDIPERVMGDMEQSLTNKANTMREDLAKGFQEFQAERFGQLLPDKPANELGEQAGQAVGDSMKVSMAEAVQSTKASASMELAGLVTQGSQEARSSIIRNRLRVPDGDKTMERLQRDQLKVQKDTLTEMRRANSSTPETGERSYSRTYIAESTSAVSEYDVLTAFQSWIPILSAHPDDSLIKLKEIKVDEGEDAYNWRVSTDYGFLDTDEQEENEAPTSRRTKRTWTFTTKTKVLDRDINDEVIQNSANDFFEEGVEVTQYLAVLQVSKNIADGSFDPSVFWSYAGKCNASTFMGADAGQVQFIPKQAVFTPDEEHGDYWEVSWEFLFDPDGHDKVRLLDQGFNKLDGSDKVKILDDEDEPVGDPRLLDGSGGELADDASPVFLERVEKSPINAGTGKRQRRQQAGNKSKLFRVKKAKDGDDFVEYIDYHSLSFGETYHFQCAPYDYPSQTEETDEEKWENVLNLASEWIPQDTIIEAWNIKGEWYCHFQRTTPPTIIVQGTASPSGPTYENFSLSVEMCSLGRVQHEIEENDEEITLSVANYT